ncbi:hypothetical protein [Streptomyces sp. NPDC002763]|uniref:hypothetical protein n=1 Tax=Streptomyces sp. NPDC002763 TaxID=3154427 RepID=UPI00331E623A
MLMLICVLLAAGVVVWNQPGRRGAGRVAAAAERLRTRLETADADGTLTDREITEAPGRARSSPGPP